ncbi:MAG: proton-conducting membrane transporter [Lachnospiraceae bacterium]|nr:proton-conducting membrane transporter [Lachnospiraceae bacterium]
MLYLIALLFPIIFGPAVSALRLNSPRTRYLSYGAVLLITDALASLSLVFGSGMTLFAISDRVRISFSADPLSRLTAVFVMLLYTATFFYSVEYMKKEERIPTFFSFYFVSFGAMLSVCFADNLISLYLCFELATLSTVPLVLHELTKEAVRAGLKYLFYSMAGALLGLLAVFFVYNYSSGDGSFVLGGFLDTRAAAGHEGVMLVMFFLGIIGFGTKAGMYPMHGWLPTAHPIAPAPGSALLSGIIAKAGVIAVIRLVFYSIGAGFLRATWVQYAWMGLAMLTIFVGSMMAFREKHIKKRLAYSTVSQISYIMLALSLLTSDGLEGGVIHMMSHSVSKGCLFLVAGIFVTRVGRSRADQLQGVGKAMPVTMWCFTIASLSLIGIPPLGGFLSKWIIAGAAIESQSGLLAVLPPAILIISALLTAGYLLPITVDAFFPGRDFDRNTLTDADGHALTEPPVSMTAPLIVLCLVALAVGLFGTSVTGLLGF